jgi:small subunit ribosomal protein S19
MARKKKGISSAKAARRKTRKRRSAIQVRRKKEFTFRGYTLPQLQELTLHEVVDLLPARSRRSFKRGFNPAQEAFMERMKKTPVGGRLTTHCRDIVVLPSFIGKTIGIYNGKMFMDIEMKPEMIGHFLGEFSPTRKSVKHSGPGVGATRSSKFMPLK